MKRRSTSADYWTWGKKPTEPVTYLNIRARLLKRHFFLECLKYLHELSFSLEKELSLHFWKALEIKDLHIRQFPPSQSVVSFYSHDTEKPILKSRCCPTTHSNHHHPPAASGEQLRNSSWAPLPTGQSSCSSVTQAEPEPSSAGELNPVWSSGIAGGAHWQPNALRNNVLINPCLGTSQMESASLCTSPCQRQLNWLRLQMSSSLLSKKTKRFHIKHDFFLPQQGGWKYVKVFLLWWWWRDSRGRSIHTDHTVKWHC